jgi:pyrroloquinoline quinone biosynthesis protein B
LLTNADLDHVLGVFTLREGGPLNLHSTKAVRSVLENSIGFSQVLDTLCGILWHEPPTREFVPLAGVSGANTGLRYRAIELPGHAPRFAPELTPGGAYCVAYQFLDEITGGRLLVAPGVAGTNDPFREALAESDAVLFDGTFWSDNELTAVKPGAPSARELGHVPIKDFSLELLSGLKARYKVYVHINNTNPILAPGTPERAAVEAVGVCLGHDGWEIEL